MDPVRRAAEAGLEVVSFGVFGTTAAQLASVQAAWEVSGVDEWMVPPQVRALIDRSTPARP